MTVIMTVLTVIVTVILAVSSVSSIVITVFIQIISSYKEWLPLTILSLMWRWRLWFAAIVLKKCIYPK